MQMRVGEGWVSTVCGGFGLVCIVYVRAFFGGGFFTVKRDTFVLQLLVSAADKTFL